MAGFEPTISESKSGVLPLHYIPISGQNQRGSGSLPIPDFVGWVKGFEPSTPGLGSRCSATELLPLILKLAKPMGFEPTISGVTGRHVNRYTTAPHYSQKYGITERLIAQGIIPCKRNCGNRFRQHCFYLIIDTVCVARFRQNASI